LGKLLNRQAAKARRIIFFLIGTDDQKNNRALTGGVKMLNGKGQWAVGSGDRKEKLGKRKERDELRD